MTNTSKKKITNGILWSTVETLATKGIQFLLSILIARLVSPSDYGIIAMLAIFLAIAQSFSDCGFSLALIQKKDRTEADFSTVFYFNLIIAIISYLLLVIMSPYIATFYKEPLLNVVTPWVGIIIIISAFSIVQNAKLTIDYNFKTLAKVSFYSVLMGGGFGLFLAWKGYGVWALIAQSITTALLNVVFLFGYTRWIPKLIFSWISFRELFSFGSKLLLGGLIHTIYLNLYSLVIGRRFSAFEVGLYSRSQSIAFFPSSNFTIMISKVFYPALCDIQNDSEKLSKLFLQSLRFSAFVIFPIMVGIQVLSQPLISCLLTDKWIAGAELLSILCLAYMWYPITYLNWQILNVKGRTDLSLKAEFIKKIFALVILFATIPFGVKIMCWGLVLYNITDIIVIIYFVKKVINVSYKEEIKHLTPVILLSGFMGICIYISILIIQNPIIQLIGGTSVGLIVYIMFSYLFKFMEFETFKSIIKNRA